MPVEFLSDEQVAAYGSFDGVPSRAELERFFLLDDADQRRVNPHRGAHNRLGFALQLSTVRFLGTFLEDPLDVPWAVVEYLADQLGVPDASVVKDYTERVKTPYEHRWEITQASGYRQLETEPVGAHLRAFLAARAWTCPERPTVLFDQAVAWLRTEKVLLPGVSVLARLVAEVRAEAGDRVHVLLAGKVTPELGCRLDGLLVVARGERSSDLDRLRHAPTRASGPQMVRALDRAAEVIALGAGQLDVSDVPPARIEGLARNGLAANAAMLRRLPPVRRTATLVATVRALLVATVDDALDLFEVLMATKLIGPADRASTKDQLRSLPALRKASATLAITARMLLDLAGAAGDGPTLLDAAAWSQLKGAVPRERLVSAVATVTGLVPDADEDTRAGQRAELVKRYATVRPFLTMLAEVVPFAATDAGQPILRAVGALAELAVRRRIRPEDVVQDLVSGSWCRLVFAKASY